MGARLTLKDAIAIALQYHPLALQAAASLLLLKSKWAKRVPTLVLNYTASVNICALRTTVSATLVTTISRMSSRALPEETMTCHPAIQPRAGILRTTTQTASAYRNIFSISDGGVDSSSSVASKLRPQALNSSS